ncbi:MAG: CaiB/BaiF CoA-transferase family protein [Chloroflexota bacterium]
MPGRRPLKQTKGPLEGVRVMDLSRATAGPVGSMLLADLGAEVIKIETPAGVPGLSSRDKADPRHTFFGEDIGFLSYNRNKKSMVLNLRTPQGKEVFYDLARKSDVVYENFRPGVSQRLGIDYDTLQKINPRIICCSLSSFGQSGPYRDKPSFDLVIQAMAGTLDICGRREKGRALWSGLALGDNLGGIFASYGVVAALFSREVTGKGQQIDLAMLDAQVSFLTYLVTYQANLGWFRDRLDIQLWGGLRTKDGIIVLDAHRQGFWENLCRALQHPEWLTDPRFDSSEKRKYDKREPILDMIEQVLLTKTTDEWYKILTEGDVPCCRLNTVAEVVKDPQVLHRNMIVTVKHPSGGELKLPGNPIKMSGTVKERWECAPGLGQHTEEILTQVLGYPEEKIARLKEQKVV